MIPAQFIFVFQFPYTSSGKVDRKRILKDHLNSMKLDSSTQKESIDLGNDTIAQAVLQIIKDNLNDTMDYNITIESKLAGINIQSIVFINIIVVIETQFDITFEDDAIMSDAFIYVKDIVDYIRHKISL